MAFKFYSLYLHSKLSKQAKQRGKKIAVRRKSVLKQADNRLCNTLLARC